LTKGCEITRDNDEILERRNHRSDVIKTLLQPPAFYNQPLGAGVPKTLWISLPDPVCQRFSPIEHQIISGRSRKGIDSIPFMNNKTETAGIETTQVSSDAYSSHVNPQWVRLLSVLEMNVSYRHCLGAELFTSDGRRYLDFLSSYCVHNAGHNHPRIVAAVKDELDRSGPAVFQSHVSNLAGELAARLCTRAGGRLAKAFFCSSGSEGIEAAIKFSRAHTGRSGLIYAEGAFHGLTCGALSLMGNPYWRDGFGPLLSGAEQVPFGDLGVLEGKLSTKQFAAYIVEPIQGEGGVRVPDPEYLRQAQALCRRYKSLFVLDEVQSGMYRTGPFLAAHHFGLDPDMVILAKALSGGWSPAAPS
jgi:ornithine--oxo-acid transaminase